MVSHIYSKSDSLHIPLFVAGCVVFTLLFYVVKYLLFTFSPLPEVRARARVYA